MKIIDLLNKIANGEEVPKKIKFKSTIYELDETETTYYDAKDVTFMQHYNFKILSDEVEIIEEEKKIPEKLIPTSLKGIDNLDEKIDVAHIDTISAIETINEIIDYLKSKGE